MSNRIIVTYATRTGSTAETAEAIARILAEGGATVDLFPMQDVVDLAPYRGVIAGSAIQNRQWLPEAVQFLEAYHDEWVHMPIAIFTLSMTLAMKNGEKYRPDVKDWLSPVRRIAKPVSEGLFAGVLDISKIPSFSDRLKFRLSVLFGVWREGDHRDWDAINAWAVALPAKLGLEI